MRYSGRRVKKRYVLAAVLAAGLAARATIQPSNQRDWTPDNARTAWAEFRGDSVYVHNVRNADYTSPQQYTVRWEDRAYDLRDVRTAWYLVEPFGKDWRGPAHTLASFGFADGRYLAVSVEIRKERGESFSPWKGLMRQYEITYVVADERDVIRLRTNFRRDSVYLYPIRTTQPRVRAMLADMLHRATDLRDRPEFYNTLTSTCTTNLARHVNRVAPHRVPVSWKVMFPGYSDRLAYDLGLIDTNLPFEAARERYHVNARALRYGDSPDFSRLIRQAE